MDCRATLAMTGTERTVAMTGTERTLAMTGKSGGHTQRIPEWPGDLYPFASLAEHSLRLALPPRLPREREGPGRYNFFSTYY